jgi:NADH:ubiquinone oxidoreductase subunit K
MESLAGSLRKILYNVIFLLSRHRGLAHRNVIVLLLSGNLYINSDYVLIVIMYFVLRSEYYFMYILLLLRQLSSHSAIILSWSQASNKL